MTHRVSVVAVASCAILLLIGGACEPGNDDVTVSGMNEEHRQQYVVRVLALQSEAGVDLLVPTYLPTGLEWELTDGLVVSRRRGEVDLLFRPVPRTAGSVGYLAFVRVTQRPDRAGRVCPPCPDSDPSEIEHFSLKGERAAEQAYQGEHVLWFISDGMNIEVTIDAGSGKSIPTAGELRTEAVRIAESVVSVASLRNR